MATFNGTGAPADKVLVDPTGLSNVTSTDAQGAIAELDAAVSGGGGNITEITATSYSILATDDTVLVNQASAVAATLTLPTGASHNTKRVQIKDKRGSASTLNVTINTSGGETIDGAASLVLNQDYAAVELVFNGTEWSIF